MTFVLRPFARCLETFAASRPGEQLNEHPDGNYDTEKAYSFDDLSTWASDPPLTALYRQRDPLLHSKDVFTDPKMLLDYANFGNAIGTWNANGEARWQCSPDEWIIADVDLVQEQADDEWGDEGGGDYVSVVFALWKVEDGYAAAVCRPNERPLLASVMGIGEWPSEGWQDAKVWYGE